MPRDEHVLVFIVYAVPVVVKHESIFTPPVLTKLQSYPPPQIAGAVNKVDVFAIKTVAFPVNLFTVTDELEPF